MSNRIDPTKVKRSRYLSRARQWGAVLFICLALGAICACENRKSPALVTRSLPQSYWVWNRETELTASELSALKLAGVTRLYWQAGELIAPKDKMEWGERYQIPAAPGLQIISVVRLSTRVGAPSRWDAESLVSRLDELKTTRLQFDFDCPVSALSEYAAKLNWLRSVRPGWFIGITALASWPTGGQSWKNLCQASSEVCPMFYDLEAERPLNSGERPAPLLDEAIVSRWLSRWDACPVPWRVGVPNLTRLTLFTATSVRHVRSWEADTMAFLKPSDVMADDSPIIKQWRAEPNSSACLVLRRASSESLRAVMQQASRTKADGVVFFSLPQQGRAANGWSISHLAALAQSSSAVEAHFTLKKVTLGDGMAWRLCNASSFDAFDLALEIKGPAGWFRECLPGEFLLAKGLLSSGEETMLPSAEIIVLRGARLSVGDALQTGLVRLAPRTAFSSLRWRVICGSKAGEWASFAL